MAGVKRCGLISFVALKCHVQQIIELTCGINSLVHDNPHTLAQHPWKLFYQYALKFAIVDLKYYFKPLDQNKK